MKPEDISQIKAVMQPVETAHGLPNGFYADPDLYKQENKVVFHDNWACIGFGKDVPEAGDARPVRFLGTPLVMVRDQDGGLRVFQNVCRHRGMILVNEPKKLKGVISCPYHAWCYELNGKLRATPHVGGPGNNVDPHIKRDELGLLEVRSHVWMDMVFVNLSGDAPDFEVYAGKLLERWKEFAGQPVFHGGADSSFKLEVNTNWKLAIENYCESYHLPWIHPGLNSYSRLEDHYHIVEPGAFSGQGSVVYNPKPDDSGRAFTNFDGLPEKWDEGAEYIALYPNVLIGIHRDHFFSILIEPVSHDKTVEHIEIYYTSPEMLEESWADLRQKNSAQWKEIFIEDIFVVEGMQRGRAAPDFDGGKFSPVMDEPTHTFHHWVASQFAGQLDGASIQTAERGGG
ncbi:MAG: aromatic ring-hydroxylating oxygenase subunit alpha [Hyphomicrobiaceae bacterium]